MEIEYPPVFFFEITIIGVYLLKFHMSISCAPHLPTKIQHDYHRHA